MTDDIDLKIIKSLRCNPQLSNKSVADQVGISKATVSSRIRSMSDNDVMRIVAQTDIFSAKYSLMCFAFVNTDDHQAFNVADEIGKLDEVISVSVGIGSPELFVTLRAVDNSGLIDLIYNQIGIIPGISHIETDLCLHIEKMESDFGDLSASLPSELQCVSNDDKEQAILALLHTDGRMSNREIGRRLNISEGSVRQKLKKMVSTKMMRLGVVCSPTSLGINMLAIMRIVCKPSYCGQALSKLATMDSIPFIALTSGKYNICAIIQGADAEQLAMTMNNSVNTIPGVLETTVSILAQTTKHRCDLVRIL